jgi:hypothetical protein
MSIGDLDFFARDLSELCRRHGLGLSGAEVFEMERDDYRLSSEIDEYGRLSFGRAIDAECGGSDRNSAPAASPERSQRQC